MQQNPSEQVENKKEPISFSAQTTPSSSTPCSPSTPSPSPIPRKLRSLNDVYARCNFCFVEPNFFEEAMREKAWRKSMQEELDAIERNKTWELVRRPHDKEVIGVECVYIFAMAKPHFKVEGPRLFLNFQKSFR